MITSYSLWFKIIKNMFVFMLFFCVLCAFFFATTETLACNDIYMVVVYSVFLFVLFECYFFYDDNKNISKFKNEAYILVFVGIFFLLSYNLVINHEIWRDEAHSFLMIRDSATPIELFFNSSLEGHPLLWHILSMPIVHIFQSVEAFQLFHIIISSCTIYIILKYSPFNIYYNILLSFGYFFLYEYNIFSRSYSLGVFLIFLSTVWYNARYTNYIIYSVLLFLISNINVMCLIYVIGFIFTEIATCILKKPIQKSNNIIIMIGLLSIVVSFLQISRAGLSKNIHLECMYDTYNAILKSFFPIPNIELNFWQTCFALDNQHAISICLLLFCLIITLYLIRLLRTPSLFFFFVVTIIGYIIFFNYIYMSSIYHCGFIFIVFITTEWKFRKSKEYSCLKSIKDKKVNTLFNLFFAFILCIHVVGGFTAYLIDYKYEFSGSKSASEYLQKTDLTSNAIAAFPDYLAIGILSYNNIKQFYSPQAKEPTSFIKWNEERKKMTNNQDAYNDIIKHYKNKNKDIIILTLTKLPKSCPSVLLFQTEKQIKEDENIFIYFVKKNDSNILKEVVNQTL